MSRKSKRKQINNKSKLIIIALLIPFVAGVIVQITNSPPSQFTISRKDRGGIREKSNVTVANQALMTKKLQFTGATLRSNKIISYCSANNEYSGFSVSSVYKYCVASSIQILVLPVANENRLTELDSFMRLNDMSLSSKEEGCTRSMCKEFEVKKRVNSTVITATIILPENEADLSYIETLWPKTESKRDVITGYTPEIIEQSGDKEFDREGVKSQLQNLVVVYQSEGYYNETLWSED